MWNDVVEIVAHRSIVLPSMGIARNECAMTNGRKKNTRPINMSRFINGTAAAAVRGKNNPKRLRHFYFTNLFLHTTTTTVTGHRRVCVCRIYYFERLIYSK